MPTREHRQTIEETMDMLAPLLGTRSACRLLGVSAATSSAPGGVTTAEKVWRFVTGGPIQSSPAGVGHALEGQKDERMHVTVKLGSVLRDRTLCPDSGEFRQELPGKGSATVEVLLDTLGLSTDEVNLVYRNHVLVSKEAIIMDGDRVALFPPNFIHFSQFYARRQV